MLPIFPTLILTLFALAIPFVVIIRSTLYKKKAAIISTSAIYVLVALPLIWIVIEDAISKQTDANIGLGLLFFWTWFLTAIAIVVAFVFAIRKLKRNRSSKQ
ncbi:hypothetical protein [Kurthia massiliensis]|uniref:hypothetical protein n=1 Tax=Kurthia massiliensis TaxID=1033739 RepID=UPI000288994E|nr:hypothetical protein [Kurthia massiliensis]